MNIELILWIVAGLVIAEVIYLVWMRYNKKYGDYDYIKPFFAFNSDDWLTTKVCSLLFSLVFVSIQARIVFSFDDKGCPLFGNGRYINLLWEALIIIAVVLYFKLNKWLGTRGGI